MKDPVTGFEYPEAWVTKCSSPDLLHLAEEGLAVLTSSGAVIRRGYTTGTTAAAACKAAILSLSGVVTSVPVHIPCGLVVSVPVFGIAGNASCKKFAGDYPDDATAGCEFIAEAMPLPEGIRFVTRSGNRAVFTRYPPLPERRTRYQSRSAGMYPHLDTGSNRSAGTFRCSGQVSRSRLVPRLQKKRSIPG